MLALFFSNFIFLWIEKSFACYRMLLIRLANEGQISKLVISDMKFSERYSFRIEERGSILPDCIVNILSQTLLLK